MTQWGCVTSKETVVLCRFAYVFPASVTCDMDNTWCCWKQTTKLTRKWTKTYRGSSLSYVNWNQKKVI